MQVDRLTLSNFKKFKEESFELHPQFTLFLGDNGAGKTAVLDALGIGIGAYLLGIQNSHAPSIRQEHVRRKTRINGEFSTFEPVTPSVVHCEGQVLASDISWKRALTSYNGRTNRIGAQVLTDRVSMHVQDKEPKTTFPVIISYGTRRLWVEPRMTRPITKSLRYPLGKLSRFDAYRGCLDPTISFEFLRRWIKKMALVSLQRKQILKSLEAVYSAIGGCIEDIDSVHYDFEIDDIAFDFQNQTRLPFGLLSDGQRNMTALVADIAMRCVQLNPHLAGLAPKETDGVVLIDDLELHLHPNWQRSIVQSLTTIFPKLQFVATTHSPFIVQSLDSFGLINLNSSGGLEIRKEQYSIEDISEEAMGVDIPQRSRVFIEKEAAADRYYKLLDQLGETHSSVQQAEEELDQIELRFMDSPAEAAWLKLHRSTVK